METGRRFGSAALLVVAVFGLSSAVTLADERGPDPQTVYGHVQTAYKDERAHAHAIRYEQYYFSAIVNAGRAYARLRPSDPEYGKLATLTVQIGRDLHYNPLTNRDAAPWWVREAAVWVSKNSRDIQLVRASSELIVRIDAMYADPQTLAKYADEDAAAMLQQHPHDNEIKLLQAEANWRSWLLTGNTMWRDRAIERAAKAGVSAERLPQVIVRTMTDDITALAPADEYFGHMNYSILGIRNAVQHMNERIDNGEDAADQESLALLVADSLCDMQKTYPGDRDITKLLYDGYALLNRVGTTAATSAATRIRTLITIEYQDTPEASEIAGRTTASR